MRDGAEQGGTSRRGVLRLLALAPAALAGCATVGAEAGRSVAPAAPRGVAPPPVSAASIGTIRSFRLPAETEPAAVFRAAASRPGEP
jgi:hypothetical protein